MRTPHIVPLSRQSLEVLDSLQALTGSSKWLFPGDRNAAKPMSNNTILKALERMGYKGTMTGHGFRGLASTILHERGCVHEYIELQLAHAPRNAVSAAYNHALYLEPRSRMMQEWADFLEQTQRGAKVLPFSGSGGLHSGDAVRTNEFTNSDVCHGAAELLEDRLCNPVGIRSCSTLRGCRTQNV